MTNQPSNGAKHPLGEGFVMSKSTAIRPNNVEHFVEALSRIFGVPKKSINKIMFPQYRTRVGVQRRDSPSKTALK